MDTLKNIRSRRGASQADFAKVINTNVSNYCNYENGLAVPCLEDCVLLESNVSERINWKDTLSPSQKQEIIDGLVTLLEHYPAPTVIAFAQRALKDGFRIGKPASLIKFFADAARRLDEEPLLPPEAYQRKLKQ